MVHSALARTTKHSMPSCEKIDTLSYSLKTWSINSKAHDTSPSSMYAGDIIMYISEKAMSERQHSKQTKVYLSPPSCTLVLPTVHPLSTPWWMRSSRISSQRESCQFILTIFWSLPAQLKSIDTSLDWFLTKCTSTSSIFDQRSVSSRRLGSSI
jgi:hypothetical protein